MYDRAGDFQERSSPDGVSYLYIYAYNTYDANDYYLCHVCGDTFISRVPILYSYIIYK